MTMRSMGMFMPTIREHIDPQALHAVSQVQAVLRPSRTNAKHSLKTGPSRVRFAGLRPPWTGQTASLLRRLENHEREIERSSPQTLCSYRAK